MISNKKYVGGVVAGLVAGLAFGLTLAIMGQTPLIPKMIGKESLALEWLINLIYSAFIGIFFVWWFGKKVTTLNNSILFGLLHGCIWWVLGALTIRPLVFELPLQYGKAFDTTNMMFLAAHFVYGIVLGFVYYKMTWFKK